MGWSRVGAGWIGLYRVDWIRVGLVGWDGTDWIGYGAGLTCCVAFGYARGAAPRTPDG